MDRLDRKNCDEKLNTENVMRRLLPPLLLVLVLVLMAASTVAFPSQGRLFGAWSWLGVVPVAVGLAVAIAARRTFAVLSTNIQTFGEPDTLVTTGLFRMSRNPMYLGMVLVALGAAVLWASPAALALAIGFFVVCDRWYVAFEERKMLQRFGAAYEAYRATTRRWL